MQCTISHRIIWLELVSLYSKAILARCVCVLAFIPYQGTQYFYYYIFCLCLDLRYTFARQFHIGNLGINAVTEHNISKVDCHYTVEEGWQTHGQNPSASTSTSWQKSPMDQNTLDCQHTSASTSASWQASLMDQDTLDCSRQTQPQSSSQHSSPGRHNQSVGAGRQDEGCLCSRRQEKVLRPVSVIQTMLLKLS